jgi:cytochrome P450
VASTTPVRRLDEPARGTRPRRTPRARTLPLVGSLPFFFRDPLAFLTSTAARGSVVDLCMPGMTGFLWSDPEDIEYALVAGNRSFIKDRFTRDLRRVLGDGLLTSEGDFWRRQRRLEQPAFHKDRLQAYAAQMVASVERTVAGFRPGEVRDVHEDLMHLTLDIVTRTLFGSGVGEDAGPVGIAVDALMAYYANPLATLVPGFFRLPLPTNHRFAKGVRSLDAITYRIIGQRRADGGADRGDLLSMLLSARDEDGGRMSDQQLRDEVMTLFLAGHETTANALSWTLFLLSRHPEVDARLAAEISATLGGRAPVLSDLPKLSYVEQVVTEAMRLYPPVWLMSREVLEPFELREVPFPKGTQIWMSQWVLHRDPRYFEDPAVFRPERWADGLAKRLPRFAYFPFGGGPRLCIGNAFAMMEATLLLAVLVQRLRFQLSPRARVVPFPSVTLRPRYGLEMRVSAR